METSHPTTSPRVNEAHADKEKMPNLDGIRAMACIFVIISHMPWPFYVGLIGETGVGIFFVLSGFLMSYLYAQSNCDSSSALKYGIARFSRIAPIYLLVISICILITLFGENDFPLKIEGLNSILRHYTFTGNVGIFWSVTLEVQYYVFFLFVWWCIANRTLLPYATPLLLLVCAALLVTNNYWPNLSVPNKLHYFLAGSIAGLLPRRKWEGKHNRIMLCLLQIASLIVLLSPVYLFHSLEALYDSVEMSIALAVAIYLLSFNSDWTAMLFATPIMRKIGQASFSIYLIHILVFYYGERLLGLNQETYAHLWILLGAAGLVIPMIISHYIEMPLQRTTRKLLTTFMPGKIGRAVPQPG